MKLSKLKYNPENPRRISPEQLDKLVKSIESLPKMMELRPIVYDPNTMYVLGGNQRLAALRKMGKTEVPDTWVKSTDEMTEKEKREFILRDNVQSGEWDFGVLEENFADFDLDDIGIELPDGFGSDDPEVTEDDYEQPDEIKTDIKLGDLFSLRKDGKEIHRLLCGAGAVMDLLHLLHHLLQAGGDAGELPRLLLLILLQPLDQAVVARDYVGQLVALAPRCQQLRLPCGIELQEGRPQSQQGPDQPAALHQGKQQGDHHQAERQGAEYGGELPVHGLAGGGEPLPQLLTGLQQLRDVLLHHLARQLLLLQRLAAALQLLGIALEQ